MHLGSTECQQKLKPSWGDREMGDKNILGMFLGQAPINLMPSTGKAYIVCKTISKDIS